MYNVFGTLLKKELKSIVGSYGFWFTAFFFHTVLAICFVGLPTWFDMGFSDFSFFFSLFPFVYIVVIPMLTISLFSDEYKLQTVKLLFLFPISEFTIVIAKYCAVIIAFIPLLLTSFIIPISVFGLAYFELSVFLFSCITTFCFAAGVIALSLALSAISQEPALSLLFSVLIIAFFSCIHFIQNFFNPSEFIQKIIRAISFNAHFQNASVGIFKLGDYIFYPAIIFFGLSLAIFILKHKRGEKSELNLQFALSVIITVLLIIISAQSTSSVDFSKNKVYSISKYTESLFNTTTEKVHITWIKSKNAEKYFSSFRYLETMLKKIGEIDNCIFEIVPADTLSKTAIQSLDLYPEQLETGSRDEKKLVTIYSGLIIEYAGSTKIVPYLFDTSNIEYLLDNNILALIQDSQGQTQKRQLYLLAPSKSLEDDYVYLQPFLEYDSFIPIAVDQSMTELDPKIPLLVLGSDGITENQIALIDGFLQQNGNAAFFISGCGIAINGNWQAVKKDNALMRLLAQYGFVINSDLLIDIFNYPVNMNSIDGSSSQIINYPYWIRINAAQADLSQSFFAGYSTLQTYWPSSMDLMESIDKTLKPVLQTSSLAKKITQNFITDPFVFSADDYVNVSDSVSTIAAVSTLRGKIFVMADENAVSRCIEFTGSENNMQFLVSLCQWLANNEKLLELHNKVSALQPFKTFEDPNKKSKIIRMARVVNIILIPLIIIILAAIVLKSKKTPPEEKHL